MTKDEIFEYFFTNSANLGVRSITIILAAGLLISLIICFTYYMTGRGAVYNAKFNASIIVILLIAVVIMLMISSNIVISLGMVGALSIVRFRTAIKDPRDTVYIFWAIAEGLSVGSQNFRLALISTLFIALVIFVIHFFPMENEKYLLIVRGGEAPVDTAQVMDSLKKYSVGIKMRSANQEASHREMIFELRSKGKELDPKCTDEISSLPGVESVNWVVESGEDVG